jgi:UDP-N-acetylglucosamine 2-epimerase (non-hydrolysing)
MIRVLTVFGTRPEAIKLAPVIKELERRPDLFDVRICVSGQHRELLDRMLELFAIRPHHDLDVMRDDQSPADVTVAVLEGLRQVFREEEPDWVLVQGDTTTTMAGGLGAFYHGCRVAHVEAGLRTFDQHDPWPEEMNRRFTGVVADLHFAPTPLSARNLLREGVDRSSVYVTGNTVVDALEIVSAMRFAPERSPLAGLPLEGKRVVVATMHRRQTSRAALREICSALGGVAAAYEDVLVVCPVHPNPNVKHPISDLLTDAPNVALVPPLDYQAMIWLLRRCRFVVTDSGGLQEEAASLGRPALVVRGRTERPEGVAAGTAKLVGTDRRTIARWARRLLDDPALYERMARSTASYGRGDAAVRIVDILAQHSNGLERTSPARR